MFNFCIPDLDVICCWAFPTGGLYIVKNRLYLADFKSHPLPPMQVQVGSATNLGLLDDRITLLRETNATLEAIAGAVQIVVCRFRPRPRQTGRLRP